MQTALFLNGVFDETLTEIAGSQKKHAGLICMLQPYSSAKITLLSEQPPTKSQPTTLYISVTTSLGQVSYRALVVGWHDKRTLNQIALAELNQAIKTYQPSEQEVYLEVAGKACVNLIQIANLQKLENPFPVSCLVKVSNKQPVKARTRAGGFAYVYAQPDWLGTLPTVIEQDLTEAFNQDVKESSLLTTQERAARLAAAPKKPEQVQIMTRAFKRNPDVVVEVLLRAGGTCEACHSPAPFDRKSDGSPYLEVHHRINLADNGDDTVNNAIALCPNCHRRAHFG